MQLRRYVNKEVYFKIELIDGGAIPGKVIKEEENYYFVPNFDKPIKIPLSSNGKNRVAFKEGILEKKVRNKAKK